MPQLTGPEQKVLVDLICTHLHDSDAIDRALIHGGLGGIALFAKDGTLPAMCGQVVEKLSAQYKIIEFTEAVLNGEVLLGRCPPIEHWLNQWRSELQQRARECPAPERIAIATAELRRVDLYVAVSRFDMQFQERREKFRCLKANKTLHEVLHQLPDFWELLGAPLEEAKRTGKVPRSAGISVRQFSALVQQARMELDFVELKEEHEEWVEALEATAAGLQAWCKDATQGDCERHLEYLSALPGQKQPALNTELAKIAMRLHTEELSESAQAVLTCLQRSDDSGAVDRAEIEAFDRTCLLLNRLIADHNACQYADTQLLVTVGRANVVPAHMRKWTIVRAKLDEMAARNPSDAHVHEVVSLAKAFESAADPIGRQAFDQFQEKFISLFGKVDKALLEESTSLVDRAGRLGATLQGFLKGLEVATTC